ncbi:hypothetical protein BDV24DRAFT_169449 [Aspergillus arachidicola]|uniref:Uncharacterized protein n=1 Tax=Aspergillus arachidicola TaxID=656916 RepID=A0A5N6XPM5_9EURO|nr:hypothetical protein BDV24DRAFT_169449 [Aspergillus arachidicola]
MSLTWAMGSLTIEPSRKSSLRRLGYLYSQHYNSGKAVFAAGSQYVFGNAGLETLALDPGLVRTWEHVGRAVSHSPLALLRAYCHTKHRCHVALTDCRNRTYGIREEYRVTGALLVALDERMRSLGVASQALTVPNVSSTRSSSASISSPHHRFPFFCHETGLMLDWLRWNINKFCLGFEMVYSLQPRTLVHWEHTRVMMMFLRCLLYTYGGQGAHPRRCNGLWLDRRVRPPAEGSDQERVDEGLGMEQALHAYGYAWLPEHKVDWASMMFRPPHRAHMVFNTPHLLTAYHRRYRELARVHSDFVIFHDVFTRMYALREDFPRSALLLQLLVDLCLQAFRKDVFEALERSRPAQPFDPRQLELALAGQVPLTIPGFRRIFRHLPPQSEFQFVQSRGARIQHIDVLFACLWGWEGDGNNGDWKRQHWENKPYRVLTRQCFESIAHVYGLRQAREWRATLRHTFIRTHWVLPYPSDRSFWSRSSGSHGRNKLQTWLSSHPGIASFYGSSPDKIGDQPPPAGPRRVIIQPQEVPALPVCGWQRSEQPMPLDIALPGIPADLDEYLAAFPEVVDTESPSAIPFPMIGVMDGPINRHVLAEAPERRELRHYLTRNNTAINHIHDDPRWLRKHLQHYLHALAAADLQQASNLTVPRTKREDIALSRPSIPVRFPEVLEEDSDEESLKYKQQRAIRKHRIHKAKLQDVQRLVNSFYKEKERALHLREKSMSHGLWNEEVIPEYRIMRAHQRQVCSLLTRISKQVLEEV